MSKVIICGSRTWDDWKLIRERIAALPEGTVVAQGGAHGADDIARICASQRGLDVREFPARWALWGKQAGMLRNQQMLNAVKPVLVIAFTYNLATSKGTRDMITRAREAGVPTEVLP